MLLSDYNYILPKKNIAQFPTKIRGNAKLLVLDKASGKTTDNNYGDILNYLKSGDVLVLNDTKVIKARLFAKDTSGVSHELVLLEKHAGSEDNYHHDVLYRGKLTLNETLYINNEKINVVAIKDGGIATIKTNLDVDQLAEQAGNVPLPPYMKRDASPDDVVRYQTEFARHKGSVAAPTASLNMTKELIDNLEAQGVIVCYLTLHVGLGTFLPIRSDKIENHTMHSEWYSIPRPTIRAIQQAKTSGNRVTAVGTTVARTLEYCAEDLLKADQPLSGEADIFIYPGYQFLVVDQLLTNFHAPKSTVLMLVAAFAGWPNLLHAYTYALQHKYMFLSYGDSMLIH